MKAVDKGCVVEERVKWLSFHVKDGFSKNVYSADNRSLVFIAIFSLLISNIDWGWILAVWSLDEVSYFDGVLFSREILGKKIFFYDAVGLSLVFGLPVRAFWVFSFVYGVFSAFNFRELIPKSHFSIKMTLVSVLFLFVALVSFCKHYQFDPGLIYIGRREWFSTSFYFFCLCYFYIFYLISFLFYHSGFFFFFLFFRRKFIK